MSAFPEISVSPWQDSLGAVPAEGACGAWLRTTCTLPLLKYQEEEAHLYQKEHSPEPVIGLFLTSFLSSVKPRG